MDQVFYYWCFFVISTMWSWNHKEHILIKSCLDHEITFGVFVPLSAITQSKKNRWFLSGYAWIVKFISCSYLPLCKSKIWLSASLSLPIIYKKWSHASHHEIAKVRLVETIYSKIIWEFHFIYEIIVASLIGLEIAFDIFILSVSIEFFTFVLWSVLPLVLFFP